MLLVGVAWMGCATSSLTCGAAGFNGVISWSQRDKLLSEFKTISSVLQPDAMMMKVVEAMKNLLPVERASVFMVDHTAGVMRTFNEVRAVAAAAAGDRTTEGHSDMPFSVSIPIDTGLAGAVVFSAQSEVVADAQRDPRFNSTIDEQTGIKTRNVISVPVKLDDQILDEIDERAKHHEPQRGLFRQMTRPITRESSAAPRQSAALQTGGEVVAVLQALNRNGSFTSADQTVLEALASLLAGVFARAQIIEAAARERKRSEALLEVAQAVNSTRECHLKALSITEAIKKGCDCERGTLVLVDEVNHEQVFVTANQDMYGMRLPLGAGISGATIADGMAVHVENAYDDERFSRVVDGQTGFQTRDILVVPVVKPNSNPPQVMGVIEALNSRRSGFDNIHEAVLHSIALQVADRLMPELIQHMVENDHANDHGLNEMEVERMRSMLMNEYAPSPLARLKLAAKHVGGVLHALGADSRRTGTRTRWSVEEVHTVMSETSRKSKVHSRTSSLAVPSSSADGTPAFGIRSRMSSKAESTRNPLPSPDLTPLASSRTWFSLPQWSAGPGAGFLDLLSSAELFSVPRGMQRSELLSWDLDILALDSKELMQLSAIIFQESGVLETFRIPVAVLAHFVAAVGARYHANPYHNFNHGVHVLLCSWLLARDELCTVRLKHSVEPLSQMHVLALLVASIGHDIDHPGVNNAFLCNSNAPLAMRYNDQSVLENHHAATTFALLGDKRCNMLATLDDKQRAEARGLMIGCILATDMARHQGMVKELSEEASGHSTVGVSFTLRGADRRLPAPRPAPDLEPRGLAKSASPRARVLHCLCLTVPFHRLLAPVVNSVLCHIADLANCAIRWELSKVWPQSLAPAAAAPTPKPALTHPQPNPTQPSPRCGLSACAKRRSARRTKNSSWACLRASSLPTQTRSSWHASSSFSTLG